MPELKRAKEIKFRAHKEAVGGGFIQEFTLLDIAKAYSCPEGYFMPGAFGGPRLLSFDIFDDSVMIEIVE